jgi:sugar phosphate isomerase/epimerase
LIPILNEFDNQGVDICFKLRPGEDLHDRTTFELFRGSVENHKRANIQYDPSHFILQQLNYLECLVIYHERIKMFYPNYALALKTFVKVLKLTNITLTKVENSEDVF